MKIEVFWNTRIKLRVERSDIGGYDFNIDRVPNGPGVYVFLRAHGKSFEALYVGETDNLRRRMKQYRACNDGHSRKIIQAIREAATGTRWLFFGEIETAQGQREKRVLKVVQDSLISHYLSLGHSLVNTQGTRIPVHEITSHRTHFRKLIPIDLKMQARGSNTTSREKKGFLEKAKDLMVTPINLL